MGDDQVARVGRPRHRVEQVAKAFDIGIVERGIDLIEDAQGRRVGQEQRKDQRDRRQRLFATRQQSERRQLLARRLRHDLKPRVEGVVAVDHFQMRLAAVEQGAEKLAKVRVDRLERSAQFESPLAVEAADRAAQAMRCLGEVGHFGRILVTRRVKLGKLLFRHKIDGTQSFPFERQRFKALRRCLDVVHGTCLETQFFG